MGKRELDDFDKAWNLANRGYYLWVCSFAAFLGIFMSGILTAFVATAGPDSAQYAGWFFLISAVVSGASCFWLTWRGMNSA